MSVLGRVDPAARQGSLLYFLLSFALIQVTFIVVVGMLAQAWASEGLLYQLLAGPFLALTLPPTLFLYLPLGFYVGISIALILDSYKYVQGVLVLVGLGIALGIHYGLQVVVFGAYELVLSEIGMVLALIVAGLTLWLAGVRATAFGTNIREYPRAPVAIMAVTAVISGLGFFEAHLDYQSPIVGSTTIYQLQSFSFSGVVTEGFVLDFVSAVVLVATLRYFISYERGLRIIMIGPARSGKSAIFGGLHLYIRDHVDESGQTAFRLNQLRASIENGEFPHPTQMAVQAGQSGASSQGQPQLLALPYSWGQFFPSKVNFHAIDYPGEALSEILANVVQKAERKSEQFQPIRSDGGRRRESDVNSDDDDGFDIPFSEEESGDSLDPIFSDESDGVEDWGLNAKPPADDSGTDFTDNDSTTLFGSDSSSEDSSPLYPLRRFFSRDEEEDSEDPSSSWDAATRAIQTAENIDEMIPGIRGCIDNADRIVLTLPLDDFVAPVIHRGNVPSYLEDRVVPAAQLSQFPSSDVRTFQYEGETYAINQPFQRAEPREYLYWYEALRSVYRDTDFVIVGTMADWMLEDFKAARRGRQTPLGDGYDDFCEHVLENVVREQSPMINQIFGGRNKGRLYLLWYAIANEEPPGQGEQLRIDTDGPYAILKGAEQFMDRVNN